MTFINEKETDDVYETLRNTDSTNELKGYISDLKSTYTDMSFSEHFRKYLNNFSGNIQDLARLSLIEQHYIYEIINGKKRADRDKTIALCLAIGMTDKECARCLERSNHAILYPKNQRDSVIIYAFRHNFTVMELNERLYKLNYVPLSVSKGY